MVDGDGNAVGLLKGDCELIGGIGGSGGFTVMTDMRVVFDDIEAKTGYKVRLAKKKDRSWSAISRDIMASTARVFPFLR